MKTKVEVQGFEVEIEEIDGMVSIKALNGGEVIEEITLDPSEYSNEASEEGEEGSANDENSLPPADESANESILDFSEFTKTK